LEKEILLVATAGHNKPEETRKTLARPGRGTNIDDISPEERYRQDQLPMDPKKTMFLAS
jgi:hypothetical protein